MKKVEFYGKIKEEIGVIMAFSKVHEELGFSKLIPSSARGFDIDSIDYNGVEVTVEFEYLSNNFISHGHLGKMEKDRKYVVVCWQDDCGLVSKLLNKYHKELYGLIEMRNYVSFRKNLSSGVDPKDEPKFIILSYNPNMAGRIDFGEWSFSSCYRVKTSESNPKFAGNKLPPGSKVLFYHRGYIIGGCTVVRYEVIEEPSTEKEWILYKKLTDYPCTLFTFSVAELKQNFLRGHIFYIDFFDISNFKVKLSHFIDKPMNRQGKINITKEEYYIIRGL